MTGGCRSIACQKDSKLAEKDLLAGTLIDKVSVRHTLDLHDARKLLLFVLSREQRVTRIQLCKNTTKRPHVDCHIVRHSQNDLGRPIESGLDVRVHLLVFETTASEINHLDAGFRGVLQQDILRLEITVHNAVLAQQIQRLQKLCTESRRKKARVSQGFSPNCNVMLNKNNPTHLLIRPRLKPWNEFVLMNSYRLIDSSSEAMQRWLRK